MNECNYVTEWVNIDVTKRVAERWKDSVWVPSSVVVVPVTDANAGMIYVYRTIAITPRKFKQHKHE